MPIIALKEAYLPPLQKFAFFRAILMARIRENINIFPIFASPAWKLGYLNSSQAKGTIN